MVNDKFILLGLDDERSKNIADILGNKTCKKMLDFLAEVKESSEKDIADNLKIPINTVEYNLKKLVKSGLIEKTPNFFWSKKGKKIEMYKLAKKHIIISPNRNFDINNLKAILPVLFVALAVIALALYIDFHDLNEKQIYLDNAILNNNQDMKIADIDPRISSATSSGTRSKSAPAETSIESIGDKNYQNLDVFEFDLRDKILIFIELILVLAVALIVFLLVRKR